MFTDIDSRTVVGRSSAMIHPLLFYMIVLFYYPRFYLKKKKELTRGNGLWKLWFKSASRSYLLFPTQGKSGKIHVRDILRSIYTHEHLFFVMVHHVWSQILAAFTSFFIKWYHKNILQFSRNAVQRLNLYISTSSKLYFRNGRFNQVSYESKEFCILQSSNALKCCHLWNSIEVFIFIFEYVLNVPTVLL